jgi:hypothetical protein
MSCLVIGSTREGYQNVAARHLAESIHDSHQSCPYLIEEMEDDGEENKRWSFEERSYREWCARAGDQPTALGRSNAKGDRIFRKTY